MRQRGNTSHLREIILPPRVVRLVMKDTAWLVHDTLFDYVVAKIHGPELCLVQGSIQPLGQALDVRHSRAETHELQHIRSAVMGAESGIISWSNILPAAGRNLFFRQRT